MSAAPDTPGSNAAPPAQTQTLLAVLEAEAALDRLSALAADVLDAPIGFIAFRAGDDLVLESCAGPASGWRHPVAYLPFCRYLADSGGPLAVDDVSRFPVAPRGAGDHGYAAFLGVPVLGAEEEVIGTLSVLSLAPRRWAERDVERLRALAACVAVEVDLRREHLGRRRAEAALHRSEVVYRQLVESASDIIYRADREGRFTYANPAASRLTGYTEEELVGMHFTALVRPDYHERLIELYQDQMDREVPTTYLEVPMLTRDRREVWVGQNVQLLRHGRAVVGLQAVARDVTALRRAAEENALLAALSRENPNPVIQCGPDGVAVHVNPAAERISRELGLDGVMGLLPENHAHLVRTGLETGQGYQNVDAAVGSSIFSWTYRPAPAAGTVYLYAVDITSRRHMEEQLRYDALHDSLTGLPNRLLFMERLAHAIVRSKRRAQYQYAVLFLDLDRFKVINDSLGHHVGDELLVRVARRLQSCLREEDTVARLGGDEFAILLEDIQGPEDATRVAERIQAELAGPVNLSGFEVFTSASIGIALSSSAYERPEYLLRNADMAMYRAKGTGQSRFEVFDRTMHAQALTRLQLETDLRRALERHEFRVHYQPIISLRTGRMEGVEALVRWAHPDRGWMSPDEFIPVAEETGLILPLGEWVLREACARARLWRDTLDDGEAVSVGVNLSAKQFSQPDLVEQVGRVLEETGLPPAALRLEITESAIMENAESAAVLLGRLKQLGVSLSLDDFGTGYSSLSYLHRFPLDALKVDRSFIGRMDTEDRSRQLVHTILALARSLGVAAVAEGVETAEQLAVLRELDCESAQGYLFARPLPPEEMERLLRSAPVW